MTGHGSDSNARKVLSSRAFVTFFKSLFGAGLLALPNVLGQVGLSLGIVIYLLVSLGCAVSCYLLLKARDVTAQYLLSQQDYAAGYIPASAGGVIRDNCGDKGQNTCNLGNSNDPATHPHPHHLVTYGDLADILLGHTMATVTRWTIISLNICFTAGLVIALCESLSSFASDEAGAMAARRAVGICLVPVVAALLQIPWLQDMWIISAIALSVYTIGVIGSTLYSAIWTITSGDESGRGMPDDLWAVSWSGVRTFTGSAVYALEGINLALPTVHSMQHPSEAIWVVCGGATLYGLLTITFAAVGYAGGLGGGAGTGLSASDCDVVTNCITPQSLQSTIQIALSVAMLLGIPIMLYPSTEMLEVMLTDRQEEKEASHLQERHSYRAQVLLVELHHSGSATQLMGHTGENSKGGDLFSHESTYGSENKDSNPISSDVEPEFSQDKSWKLRLFLAILTVVMGTVTKSFTHFSGFVGALGLSFAGFVLPPLLYLRAMQLADLSISRPMKGLMAALAAFGAYNMVIGGFFSFIDLVRSF